VTCCVKSFDIDVTDRPVSDTIGAVRMSASGVIEQWDRSDAPTGRGDALALVATARPAWQADALCREYPHLSWHPARGEPIDEVLAVCSRCVVRAECLDYALVRAEPHGVWGGLSVKARRKALRSRRADATSPHP
jgi:WhiB family redox-sensing transcriptional regulator